MMTSSEHLLAFNKHKDAQSLYLKAIEARFGRLQKIWQLAIAMDEINERFNQRTGKRIIIIGKSLMMIAFKKGFSFSSKEPTGHFIGKMNCMLCDQIVVLKRDASFNESDINALKKQVERLKKEKENNQFKIDNFENASKSLDQLIGNQISDNNKKG
ncbi:hypothetical protein Tco_0544932 [Tanacetum coccineum]